MEVIFGPPGTGKTTELSRLVRQYAEEDGPDSLLLSAFTRTAAREMAGRDLPLSPHQVGTLHSHCYQALDHPTIAEGEWKKWNEAYPVWALSPQADRQGAFEDGGKATLGDECLAAVSKLRHELIPKERWPPELKYFAVRWEDWKQQYGYKDYADLIEDAYHLIPVAPGNPSTLIFDEAQDFSLLQWRLLERWGEHATRVIAAGDDDQALYRWAGADFHPLLAAASRRVLPQSYRVPCAVQGLADRHVRRVRDREPKAWAPRSHMGTIARLGMTWECPEPFLQVILQELEAPFGSLACVAPCGYMLAPLIQALRSEGVPFGNNWRPTRRDWNPLRVSKGVSAAQRLADFIRPVDRLWTWPELSTWLPWVHAERVLHRGAKKQLALHDEATGVVTLDELATLIRPDALAGVLHGGATWFGEHVLQSHAKTLAYPLRVAKRYGREALFAPPRITLGTIHSLKGGEADTVILINDLSRAQRIALLEGGSNGDDVWRMLYVGITRARDTLYTVGASHA